jgi:hypothetical protein
MKGSNGGLGSKNVGPYPPNGSKLFRPGNVFVMLNFLVEIGYTSKAKGRWDYRESRVLKSSIIEPSNGNYFPGHEEEDEEKDE